MSVIQLNGRDVFAGSVHMPRSGVWHADLEIEGDAALSGAVAITEGALKFSGTVYRSAQLSQRTFVRLRGGAGGMGVVLPARSYVDVPLSVPLFDILNGAGESLSATVPTSLLSLRLPHWTTTMVEAGTALSQLAAAAKVGWRVLADGTVWLGVDTYPEQKLSELERLDPDPLLATYVIAPAQMDLRPGVTFDGHKVSRVEHQIGEHKLRTVYWAEDAAPGSSLSLDRIKEPLARFVRWVMRDVRYYKLYPATVQGQDGGGLLDLYPDDETIRGTGTSRVPIKHGVPGITVKVPVGARVMLGFANGDPQSPYAALWDTGQITNVAVDGGTRPVARVGDTVLVFFPVTPMPISGVMGGVPFSGLLTIATSAQAIIQTGNPKLLA